MTNQQPKSAQPIDEFDSAEYGTGLQSLPYLQVLNNDDPQRAGLFLSADNAAAVNFQATAEWEAHEAKFYSGGASMGYRSLAGRMVILRRSPLLMFSRESRNFLGVFDRESYDVNKVLLKTRYLVYLVDDKNQLLHEHPLQFTTKGSICGSFGQHYQHFRAEMNNAYGKTRGDRFFALTVFDFKLTPMLKGKEKKSWVCSVTDHEMPTAASWKNFFLGYDPQIKAKLLADFDAHQDFGQTQRMQPNNFDADEFAE